MDWNEVALMDPPTLAMMATIYGGAKVGKTELVSSFPGLVIMAFENPGPTIQGRKDIKITPLITGEDFIDDGNGGKKKVIKCLEHALGFLRWLYNNPGKFQTLSVETVTRMSKLFEAEILFGDPKKPKGMGDALGGYGKSYDALAKMHQSFVDACMVLRRDRGMNIVFVAHDEIGKISPPDEESYNYYTLDMHEDSAKHYINNSDIIAYIHQRTLLSEGDDKKVKVASTDKRILTCKSSAAHVSGNRYGITQDIVLEKGKNPLEQYLKADRVSGKIEEGEF